MNLLKGEADNIEVLNSKIQNVRDILDEIQHPKTPPENIRSVTEIIANEKEKMYVLFTVYLWKLAPSGIKSFTHTSQGEPEGPPLHFSVIS